jgi:hypothetical protein
MTASGKGWVRGLLADLELQGLVRQLRTRGSREVSVESLITLKPRMAETGTGVLAMSVVGSETGDLDGCAAAERRGHDRCTVADSSITALIERRLWRLMRAATGRGILHHKTRLPAQRRGEADAERADRVARRGSVLRR